jgi:mannosyl-oligosaccharide glucosidase
VLLITALTTVAAATLDQGIPVLLESYNKRFEAALPFPADYPAEKRKSLEAFSKAVTSNLIGGIGYFYGNSSVDKKFSYEWDEDEDAALNDDGTEAKGARLTEPRALLTATPSRSFFPRGFYWCVSRC